jgi:hypothetical protein
MIKEEDQGKVASFAPTAAGAGERLPYAIELWDLPRIAPEKVLGRAASVVLARAIFAAAATEHLGRRLVLRRGSKVLLETD